MLAIVLICLCSLFGSIWAACLKDVDLWREVWNEGFTALVAKRVIVVPFQKGELLCAVRAEVGPVAVNFVARDKKLCLPFEKSRRAEHLCLRPCELIKTFVHFAEVYASNRLMAIEQALFSNGGS